MTEERWTDEEENGVPETAKAEQKDTIETETVQPADIMTVDKDDEEEPRVEIEKTEKPEGVNMNRALCGAAGGIVLAVLFLTIGFWKTLFIAAMGGLGAFLFGIRDKQQILKDLVNRLFPPKD